MHQSVLTVGDTLIFWGSAPQWPVMRLRVESSLQVSPGEYLETALQPVRGAGRSVEAKNAVSTWPLPDKPSNVSACAFDPLPLLHCSDQHSHLC